VIRDQGVLTSAERNRVIAQEAVFFFVGATNETSGSSLLQRPMPTSLMLPRQCREQLCIMVGAHSNRHGCSFQSSTSQGNTQSTDRDAHRRQPVACTNRNGNISATVVPDAKRLPFRLNWAAAYSRGLEHRYWSQAGLMSGEHRYWSQAGLDWVHYLHCLHGFHGFHRHHQTRS